ncbi:MAG TPA: aminotransferase class I/II-fold pyridoxal phosphate-dependent enzyme [Gemmataceae bacterium]|nr:aminotransferase class I/II-fold pyridoxal phosphate-dependent enzyme [Gemmataceae bacterium]
MSSFPDLGPSRPLAPPLFTSAVYTLPDLDALDAISDAGAPGFIYARDGHPNAHSLATKLTALEAAQWGIVCGTGMAALSAAFLSLLDGGGQVVASNRLYGRTSKLLRQELPRFGVTTTSVDVSDLTATREAVAAIKPKVLYAETMSNPMCRVPDLAALAEIANANGARLVVDNTFATPVLCRPLELGAHLVMESLTKMIGGHSDVILGFLCGCEAELFPTVSQIVTTWGLAAGPFDCWTAERGLQTLELRERAAVGNAMALADWLAGVPGVTRVVYPGRSDHPDHELAKRQFPIGCGNMLCFELAGGRDAVNRFMRSAPGIPFSPSLGHVTTTISYPAGTSHRYDSPAERAGQGITDGLIRVSVGCEPSDQIAGEMAKGLA